MIISGTAASALTLLASFGIKFGAKAFSFQIRSLLVR